MVFLLHEMQAETKCKVMGQVLLCKGCCCGQTERGKPEVPLERLKDFWKKHKLGRGIQLTLSGCLGPCDSTNVVCVLTPNEQIWLGNITHEHEYDALAEWALECVANEKIQPLPESLKKRRMDRWKAPALHPVVSV